MTDSTFTNNFAAAGGAICNTSIGTSTVIDSTVIDSIFTDNSANNGGAFYNGGMANMSGNIFSGNSAVSGSGYISIGDGGGLYNDGTLTVSDNTFTGNTAFSDGGGIDNDFSATATVTNCTVSGNTSQDGGGIANHNGGNLTLNNTIVAGNTSIATGDNDISGSVTSGSEFNFIGDGSGIPNLIDLEVPVLNNLIGTTSEPLNPCSDRWLTTAVRLRQWLCFPVVQLLTPVALRGG